MTSPIEPQNPVAPDILERTLAGGVDNVIVTTSSSLSVTASIDGITPGRESLGKIRHLATALKGLSAEYEEAADVMDAFLNMQDMLGLGANTGLEFDDMCDDGDHDDNGDDNLQAA